MNQLFLKLAITAAAGSLLSSSPIFAQVSPTTPKTAHVQITQGPEIELAKEYLTIIRWTTNNPGGLTCVLRHRALRYGPQELKRDREIPHAAKSGSSIYNFPCALDGPKVGDDILLYGWRRRIRWRGRQDGERDQAIHPTC
jgi:hypothetical protein